MKKNSTVLRHLKKQPHRSEAKSKFITYSPSSLIGWGTAKSKRVFLCFFFLTLKRKHQISNCTGNIPSPRKWPLFIEGALTTQMTTGHLVSWDFYSINCWGFFFIWLGVGCVFSWVFSSLSFHLVRWQRMKGHGETKTNALGCHTFSYAKDHVLNLGQTRESLRILIKIPVLFPGHYLKRFIYLFLTALGLHCRGLS